jgi:signal transduction histidine kinase
VLACAELIESIIDSVPVAKTKLLIGQISTSARRINAIITNLLDVNAIDSGQRRLQLASCPLHPIVERVVEQNRLKARTKEIEIDLTQAASELIGMIDENAAEQVLDNLVSNAVKYSPQGSRVAVRVVSGSECVGVSIQDQGPGISEADQSRMYGKFCRLSAKPTAGEPTTGLGLWIVKELTESMNGRIMCESEVGSGTTFTVLWPKAPGAA